MQFIQPSILMISFSFFLEVHWHSWYGSICIIEKLSQLRFCKDYKNTLVELKCCFDILDKRTFINENKIAKFAAASVEDHLAIRWKRQNSYNVCNCCTCWIHLLNPILDHLKILFSMYNWVNVLQTSVLTLAVKELSSQLVWSTRIKW